MTTWTKLPASKLYCPLYTQYEAIKELLANKVQFQSDPNYLLDGDLPDSLLGRLIARAETRVEQDCNSRYMIPFQSIRTGRFIDLPDHTQRAILVVVELRAVMEVLMTDFGRGTHVNAESYFKSSEEEYESYIDRLLGRNKEGENSKHDRFRFSPPLAGLRLAASNREADDGYKGMIINTDGSNNDVASYAEHQINNPGASYVNARLDAPENPL